MKPIRVVVSGSRNWTDREVVWSVLDMLAGGSRESGRSLLVAHGQAAGADTFADGWVNYRSGQNWPVEADRWPADWTQGRSAGVRRNLAMLKPGADAVVVFLLPCSAIGCKRRGLHGSHGATHCGEHAEGLGIPVRWIDPKGVRP